MGVNPHDCIRLGIEVGRPSQCFDGNVVFLEAGRFPLKMLLADISENAGEIWSPLKQNRSLHSLKFRTFAGERIQPFFGNGSGRHGLAPKRNRERFVSNAKLLRALDIAVVERPPNQRPFLFPNPPGQKRATQQEASCRVKTSRSLSYVLLHEAHISPAVTAVAGRQLDASLALKMRPVTSTCGDFGFRNKTLRSETPASKHGLANRFRIRETALRQSSSSRGDMDRNRQSESEGASRQLQETKTWVLILQHQFVK